MKTVQPSNVLIRWVAIMAALVIALTSVSIFVVNDNDTQIIRDGSLRILTNTNPYALSEANNTKSGFMNPPHIALLGLPFVIFGAKWSAVWNVFFVLLIITGKVTDLRGLAVRLMFIFTAPLLLLLASANISGTTTGIGLLLLLFEVKGPLRGVAWGYLLLRPQDSWIILLYDGVRAIRARDYKAIITCTVIVLMPVLFAPDVLQRWLAAMRYPLLVDSPVGYSLSLTGTHGPLTALAFIAIVMLLRIWTYDRVSGLRWRRRDDISQAEFFWFMAIAILVLGQYTAYYMLWLSLIIVRDYGAVRALLLLIFLTVVGLLFMTEPNPERAQAGMLLTIIGMAVLSPRHNVLQETHLISKQLPKLAKLV